MNQPGAVVIAVAVCLLCLASGSAPSRADEGNHKDLQYKRSDTPRYPYAITCAVAVQEPRWEAAPTEGNKQEPRYAPRSGAAGNKQEPIRAEGKAGNQQEPMGGQEASRARSRERGTASSESVSSRAGAVGTRKAAGNQQYVRYAPGAKIPVPDGRDPAYICPRADIVLRFYAMRPGVIYQGTWHFAGLPLPPTQRHDGGGH